MYSFLSLDSLQIADWIAKHEQMLDIIKNETEPCSRVNVAALTGSEVSWLRLRLSVSSWVHWSMQRDSSEIWLLLRLSLFKLPRE